MFNLTGNDAQDSWCVYALCPVNSQTVDFVWYCKLANVAGLTDALKNPEFDRLKQYTCFILGHYKDRLAACNGASAWMHANGMPPLNKTQWINRRNPVMCEQTGQVWNNAAECAKQLGINPSQLSQHLRRVAGYKSIRNMTFINTRATITAKPVQFPPPV